MYDAETIVYSNDGGQIGTFNYDFGLVDSICNTLKNCKVIYRSEHHISSSPFIDSYA